jgi:hypothetical protein
MKNNNEEIYLRYPYLKKLDEQEIKRLLGDLITTYLSQNLADDFIIALRTLSKAPE